MIVFINRSSGAYKTKRYTQLQTKTNALEQYAQIGIHVLSRMVISVDQYHDIYVLLVS